MFRINEIKTTALRTNVRLDGRHSTESWEIGGRDRDRTCDLIHAMDALSQLSYTPVQNIAIYQWGDRASIS
jgi:hypothetical protein